MLRINPAIHRHPAEAAIIGRIVIAFGELEYMACLCAGKANGSRDLVLKALYRLRATSARIDAADALMRPAYHAAQLAEDYATMLAAVWRCHQIRNQYAHCHWADGDMEIPGLFFVDLQTSAHPPIGFEFHWKHVDVPLLEAQEAYFVHALEWLRYLENELIRLSGKRGYFSFPRPPARAQPPLHNTPSQHPPPWLDEGQKARHIARALEAEAPARSPQRERKAPKLSSRQKRDAARKPPT